MSTIENSSSSNDSLNPSHGNIQIYKKNKEKAKKMISDENNYFLQAIKNLKPIKNKEGILSLDIKDIEQYEIATSIQAVLDSRSSKKNDQPKIEYIKKDINTEITEWARWVSPQFELYSKVTKLKKEQQAFIKEISRLLSKEIEKSITKDKEEALKTVADELATVFESSNIRWVDSLNIGSENFINKTKTTISEKVNKALQIPGIDTSTRQAFENYNTIFDKLQSAGILNAFIDCNKARSCYVATYLPEFIKQDTISPVVQERPVAIEQINATEVGTNNMGHSTTESPIAHAVIIAPPPARFNAADIF